MRTLTVYLAQGTTEYLHLPTPLVWLDALLGSLVVKPLIQTGRSNVFVGLLLVQNFAIEYVQCAPLIHFRCTLIAFSGQ